MPTRNRRKIDDAYAAGVAGRVAEVRRAKGWSQAGLAHDLGIEATTLSRYEVGQRPFPLPLLARIAAVLGVAVADLLPGEASVPPESAEEDLHAIWKMLDSDRQTLLLRLARELVRR